VIGVAAFVVAVDGQARRLFERHGYTAIGSPQVLPGGLPVWAMWRPPGRAGPR
jgi:hypothetical protein